MDLRNIELTDRAYSSSNYIPSLDDDLEDSDTADLLIKDTPKSGLVKKNKRFSSLSINIRKSKFLPKKKLSLDDKFEVKQVLGAGAYSTVKAAYDKINERNVAIKTCHRENAREMLNTEYSLLKRLNHKNIIEVYDLISDDAGDVSHMVMEQFCSQDLSEYIEEHGTFSEDEAQLIIIQLLKAINYLHENGVTHADIKPENILIGDDLSIKLIDFNISRSKCVEELSPEDDTSDTKSESNFSANLSSPLYAAPEVRKCKHSESVDLWGVGIVLFSCILGTLKSHSLQKVKCTDERGDKITQIIESDNNITSEAKAFMTKLLQKDGDLRPKAREALLDPWMD